MNKPRAIVLLLLGSAALIFAGCRRSPDPVAHASLAGVPWNENLLLRDGVVLTAGSHAEAHPVESLLDNDPSTFWQVDEEMVGSPAWVEADFGEGEGVAVRSLAARPRRGFGFQFFRHAEVQASHDGDEWKTLARIEVPEEPENRWQYFSFPGREPYRFWRLLVRDGFQGPGHFWSMGGLAFFESSRVVEPPPNIVFVVLDAARADHFSGYGYDQPTTPAIDAIAEKGAVFLKAFSPASETYDAMPLIWSSRYFSSEMFQKDDWRWGVRRGSSPEIFQDYDDEQMLLTELLAGNGYRTAIVHDHWWFVPETDFVAGFHDHFHIRASQPTDEAIVEAALSWIDENRDGPFFVYLHVMSPHIPFPRKDADLIFIEEDEVDELEAVRRKFNRRTNDYADDWSPREIELLKALYDGNLRHSDGYIGELYSRLERWGLASNTLFVLSSDHGENLGQHNRLQHGGPHFDSVLHVPLIMVLPGRIPAGVKVEGLVELIDIVPTIADLGGLRIPEGKIMDGVSLRSFIENPRRGKEAIYTQSSIRTERHKVILFRDDNRLFDIVNDPGEERNIAEEHPEILRKLENRHERFLRPFRDRYLSTRRSKPPEYSFYLPLRQFSVSPREVIRVFGAHSPPSRLFKELPLERVWQLNTETHRGGLFCLPSAAPVPPIEISIAMPDGPYQASALVEILDSGAVGIEELGLLSRFSRDDPFLEPLDVRELSRPGVGYLDWGEVTVEDENFAAELQLRPGDQAPPPFFIHHIRFDPVEDAEGRVPAEIDEEELRRRREGLRSLGYL